MRKLLWLLLVSACLAQSTPNLNFNIPSVGTPAWGPLVNANFTLLDGLLSGTSALPNLKTKVLNNVQICGNYPGATIDAQLNACIAAVIAQGGGIADARGMGSGTLSSEVDVGNSASVTVVLLLPPTGQWTATMAGGGLYALKVFNKSAVLGYGAGEGQPFNIQAGAASSLDSVCGTDPSPGAGGSYVRMEGFTCTAASGAIVGNAVLNIQRLFDESYIGKLTAGTFSTSANKVFWAHALCCSTTVELINAEGNGLAGAIPCTISTDVNTSQVSTNFRNFSCVHPGSGKNALVLNQSGAGNIVYANKIENIYVEVTAAADLTTAAVAVTGTAYGADVIGGITLGQDRVSSTRYLVDIAAGSKVDVYNLTMGPYSSNAVNDHNAIATTAPVNSNVAAYVMDPVYYSGTLRFPVKAFASLGTPVNGSVVYCSDCNSTCSAGASTGRTCFRENGVWVH